MRGRPILVITVSAMLLAIGVTLLFLRDIEPSYNGRSLVEWIKASSQRPDDPEVNKAIISITSKSAPLLLSWVLADTSPRFNLINKLPMKWYPIANRNQFLRRVFYRDNEMLHAACAMRAFEIAGTNAASAVPALAARISDYNPQVTLDALHVCSLIGPPALPVIRHAMSSRMPFIRTAAIGSLKPLGTNGIEAIPDLVKALSDYDIQVRENATNVLEILLPSAFTNAGTNSAETSAKAGH